PRIDISAEQNRRPWVGSKNEARRLFVAFCPFELLRCGSLGLKREGSQDDCKDRRAHDFVAPAYRNGRAQRTERRNPVNAVARRLEAPGKEKSSEDARHPGEEDESPTIPCRDRAYGTHECEQHDG